MRLLCCLLVGLVLLASRVWAAAPEATIAYTLPTPALVTINILDDQGWIVRELIRAERQPAGPHQVVWDGCDGDGAPLPPGAYRWKLLYHTGLQAKYVLSVANSGQPPYRTENDKGSWGGCHGNPLAVAADASGLYLTWTVEEGNAVFTKTDYDGKALYKIHHATGWTKNFAATVGGTALYRLEVGMQQEQPTLFLLKYDAMTGKAANWTAAAAEITGNRLKLVPPAPLPKGSKQLALSPSFTADSPATLAANGRWVAVGYPGDDRIALYTVDGARQADLQVASPRGMAFLPDGRLAVCGATTVEVINLHTREVTSLITRNLSGAWGIAVAQDGKSLWITDQGASQQVKQFSLAGTLLKTLGKAGGMAEEGRIDHASFYRPCGIACGADGNIYVTEDSPLKRIVRLAPEGRLLREWFGPLGPQKTCWPNLQNFSEVYYNAWGVIIQCYVDLAKKIWVPVAWYRLEVPNTNQPVVWERDGRKYLYAETNTIYQYDAKADRWRAGVAWWMDDEKQPARQAHLWTDGNGNGEKDAAEVQSLPLGDFQQRGFGSLGLSFGRIDPQRFTLHGVLGGELAVLTPVRITANGLPVYSFDQMKRLTRAKALGEAESWYDPFPIYGIHGCEPAADGGVFTAFNGGRQQHLNFWDRASWNYLAKFDANGALQWRAGVHTRTGKISKGNAMMFFRVCGLQRGLLFLSDAEAQVHVYTEDGLYVDWLMDGPGAPLSPNSLTVEHFTGLAASDPQTKKLYYFAGSTEDARIWEITGMESLQRLAGTVTLASAAVPAGAPGRDARYTIAASTPPRAPIYNDGGADGFLNEPEWTPATCLPLTANGVLRAKVYLRHDDKYLWVGAQVWDPSPARNTAQEPAQAVACGDGVDLYFGSDATTSRQRETGDAGDVRVLLAPLTEGRLYNGKAIFYRPRVQGEQKPYTFTSPAGTVTLASVTVSPAAQVTFFRWASGHGYTCEAKIPLSELPELGILTEFTPARTSDDIQENLPPLPDVDNGPHAVAFDCGVLYATPDGAERIYWHQRAADLPIAAQLYPRHWGMAVMGR